MSARDLVLALGRLLPGGPSRLAVRRRELAPPGWPPALDGLRVALVSDLHAGGPHVDAARVAQVAARAAAERPDLALLLGDFVDPKVMGAEPERPADVAAALAALASPLGRFAVLGNHDWAAADGNAVRRALAAHGTTVLENDAVEARWNGEALWIAGVADVATRRPDLDATLAPVPDGAPVLLLTHHPDLFPKVPRRVALTVAGHTHGGQVNLPVVRRRVIPSRHGDRYAAGPVEEDGRLLYVTSGVGESGWPVRLLRPPEVVILTLRSG